MKVFELPWKVMGNGSFPDLLTLLKAVVFQTTSSIICGILTGWVVGQVPPRLRKLAGPVVG